MKNQNQKPSSFNGGVVTASQEKLSISLFGVDALGDTTVG